MSEETSADGQQDRTGRTISLSEITDENWRAVADVAPHDEQRRFVAALGARYLLLSLRGGLWHSLAIQAGDAVAGHVMWAYDSDDDAHWIGGMLIDAAEQGNGVGRAALQATIRLLSGLPDAREIRLSYHPDNTAAARLYTEAGFRPTGQSEDDEIVVARPIDPAARG
jgi:diamine N-acetyltransferase